MSNKIYEIRTAQELSLLAKDPTAAFSLQQDVDMEGAQWTPVTGFSGTFAGNGKTISNLQIRAENTANAGFFGDITPQGRVEALHLENICVSADEQVRYIGGIVGTNCGSVTDCTVTGQLQTQEQAAVGCLAGRVEAGAVLIPGTGLSYTDPVGVQTEGLSAIVKLTGTEGAVGLAGQLPEGMALSGLWLDISRSSKQLPQQLQDRRAKVVDYMMQMATVQWTPTKTLVYMPKVSFKPTSISFQIYLEGKTYTGIPYNHSHGSLQRFMACLDQEHRVKDWVNGLGPVSIDDRRKEPYETSGFAQYIGNDCSGAVYWAWLQVSPGEVADVPWGRGVRVNLCQHIVPNGENVRRTGVYPVGSYVLTHPEGPELEMTEDILHFSGENAIMEAYAQAYPGDAVLAHNRHSNSFGSSGHIRMLTQEPVVVRKADGTIEPYLSYLTTVEQGDGQLDARAYTDRYSWRVNYKHTFRALMDGAENCANAAYVPVTIRALWDAQVAQPYVKLLSQQRAELYSNYRIISTTLTVHNAAGEQVYQKEAFTGTDGNGDNFTERPEARDGNSFSQIVHLKQVYRDALASVPSGESYRYELSVLVSDGTQLCRDKEGKPLCGTGIKQ